MLFVSADTFFAVNSGVYDPLIFRFVVDFVSYQVTLAQMIMLPSSVQKYALAREPPNGRILVTDSVAKVLYFLSYNESADSFYVSDQRALIFANLLVQSLAVAADGSSAIVGDDTSVFLLRGLGFTCPAVCGLCDATGNCLDCAYGTNRDAAQNCTCLSGYIDGEELICAPCDPSCEDCLNANTCTGGCIGLNRLGLSQGCVCAPGYYDDGTSTCRPNMYSLLYAFTSTLSASTNLTQIGFHPHRNDILLVAVNDAVGFYVVQVSDYAQMVLLANNLPLRALNFQGIEFNPSDPRYAAGIINNKV